MPHPKITTPRMMDRILEKLLEAINEKLQQDGRVSQLRVKVRHNCTSVTLLGRCKSYYMKQVAQTLVMQVIKERGDNIRLMNDMEVIYDKED